MSLTFQHTPVLLEEVVAQLRLLPTPPVGSTPLRLVDCTVGGAGHAQALLQVDPQALLLALDTDPEAVHVAQQRLAGYGARAQVRHAKMSHLPSLLAQQGWPGANFVLADLGVSSYQLDNAARGFAFRPTLADAPLDMRLDQSSSSAAMPAWEWLERLSVTELQHYLKLYGEERRAKAVARAIKQHLPRTTHALAQLVRQVVRRAADKLDPATRTFQALRMLVNDELGELQTWLQQLPQLLLPGGIAVVISFHSLEDRAVKRSWLNLSQPCTCPPHLPVCLCGRQAQFKLLRRRVGVASGAEKRLNRRARSARLRVLQRFSTPSCQGVSPC